MKKIFAVIISVFMLFSLCACAAGSGVDNGSAAGTNEGNTVTGGWTRTESPVVTEKVSGLLNKSLEASAGASFIPVAYIGTQAVAGTNHAVLCRTAPSVLEVPGAEETWAIVYIYEDLEGNAEIIDVKDFRRTTDIAGEDLDGGWQLFNSPVVTDEVRTSLEKAQETLAGASFYPVAQLTSQIVAGTNYCVLCEETGSVLDAQPTYALVYVYADLDGNAEITETVDLTENGTADNGAEEFSEDDNLMQIPNPFVDYASLDEAAKAAGFELTAPDSVEGYGEKIVQVMDNSMIQVIYLNGESRLFVRKQAGSGDISGDYNEYPQQCGVEIGDYVVSMKGADDKINVAVWTNNGYAYAVTSDEALSADEYIDIISQIA